MPKGEDSRCQWALVRYRWVENAEAAFLPGPNNRVVGPGQFCKQSESNVDFGSSQPLAPVLSIQGTDHTEKIIRTSLNNC